MEKIHLTSGDVYINTDKGFFYFVPENELEDFLEDEHSHYTPIPDHELLKVFPQAKTFVKEELKKYKRLLCREADYEIEANGSEFLLEMCELRRGYFRDKIKRLERMLAPFDSKKRGETLARLKSVPIGSLLKVSRAGFAFCPFHFEKSPSLKVYKDENRFYCFSCSKSGDSVDIQCLLSGKSLKELLA